MHTTTLRKPTRRSARSLTALCLAALCVTLVSCQSERGSYVQLRPDSYAFPTTANAERRSQPQSFTLKTEVCLADFTTDRELLSVPGVLSMRLRQHSPTDTHRQNYPAGTMPDGRVPVLEAVLRLNLPEGSTLRRDGQPATHDMVVGVPLALLPDTWGRHDVTLDFTGVSWDMYVDGSLADRDFALGYPDEVAADSIRKDDAYIIEAEVYTPGIRPTIIKEKEQERVEAQYFTPRGHNAWVGDVATIWYQGRYHVFYLLDRRGHESKCGRGGHYFEHLSTADFRHWTEHEAAVPIEEQWETLGTGTPFVWHDTLFLSYGMHTSRLWPSEQTSTPRQWQYIREYGESQSLPFACPFEGDEDIPSGASYAVSADGVARFRKSHILIHPAENPTIYVDREGRLGMLANYGARGTWTSDRLDGGWHCISEDFPPGGDCTFIFRWNQYDYIVGGFTHMWMKRADETTEAYRDMVARGEDIYDGLSVPSICELPDGRHLMAGWVQVNRHWGGALVIRELIQYPDGRIGSRFMPELMPATKGRSRRLTADVPDGSIFQAATEARSFLLTFNVIPQQEGQGRVTLDFTGDHSDEPCQWTLDLAKREARFGEGRTLHFGGQPHQAGDYAIGNLRGTDEPFTIRMIIRGEPKLGGSLIDTEIAGQRTMICHRSGLRVTDLALSPQGSAVRDLRIQPLQ